MLTSALGVFSVWMKIVRTPPTREATSTEFRIFVCDTVGLRVGEKVGVFERMWSDRE